MNLAGIDFIDKKKLISLPAHKDIQDVVADILLRSGPDLSMNIVVYPGRRPAQYLRMKLLEKLKGPFVPPKIYSIDDLILYLHELIFGERPIDSFEAILLIYKICIQENLIEESSTGFDEFYPLGEKILSAIEELHIECVPTYKLKEVESLVNIPLLSKKNIYFLFTIYDRFYKELCRLGISSRSKRYVDIAQLENINEHLKCSLLIFCGFYALSCAEKRILSRLSERDGFLFIYNEEGSINEKGREINFYSAPDRHGQVKIIGEILKKEEKNSITIVLPNSDTLFPLLRNVFSTFEKKNYNISLGYPLSRTPIYSFFLNLFEVVETSRERRVYVPAYLRFLLHPYVKNIEFMGSSETARILHQAVDNIFRKEMPFAFVDLSWIEKELPAKLKDFQANSGIGEEKIRNHLKTIHSFLIEPFFEIKNVRDFFEKCSSSLFFIYEKSTAQYHPLFYPYCEAFLEEFRRICFSLLANYTFEKKVSYFNLFSRLFTRCFFPFEGDPKAKIQILGFLETRNLKFDTIIFPDLNEGIFPDLSEDYLLSQNVRSYLGLPTTKDKERLIFHYFNLLVCGAKRVHLLFLENPENTRSRFIERIIWEMEKEKGAVLDENKMIKRLSYRINLSNLLPSPVEKKENIKKILAEISLSPSAIDDYLKCGIRFYLKYVLTILEEKPIQDHIESTEIGNIVHLALKRFFEKKSKRVLRGNLLSFQEMAQIVDDLFYSRYGHVLDGKAFLTKKQIEKRLFDYINYLKEVLTKDTIRIIEVERYVEEELHGTIFSFRIDLVQERNGKIEIIDFKTTADKNKFVFRKKSDFSERKSFHTLPSFQIPLYIILYAKKENLSPFDLNGYYFLFGTKNLDTNALVDPFQNIDHKSAIEMAEEVVRKVVEEIKDPSFPFLPPFDIYASCPFCVYRPFCGTLWVAKEPAY